MSWASTRPVLGSRSAWKFTANRSDARVAVGRNGDEDGASVLFVRDNGTGFDMADADKLFGMFQLDPRWCLPSKLEENPLA